MTTKRSNQTAVDKTIGDALAESKAQMVQAASRPNLVGGLRSTWRKSAQHFAEQVSRFLRLTALAALPSLLDLIKGGKFDTYTLFAFVLPFAEVAYRQVFPALGAAAVDAAPGATIVPAEIAAAAGGSGAEGDASLSN